MFSLFQLLFQQTLLQGGFFFFFFFFLEGQKLPLSFTLSFQLFSERGLLHQKGVSGHILFLPGLHLSDCCIQADKLMQNKQAKHLQFYCWVKCKATECSREAGPVMMSERWEF